MRSLVERGNRILRQHWVLCAVIFISGTAVSSARGASVTVGDILVEKPEKLSEGTIFGEKMYARYDVDLANTCLKDATVHWIQLVTTSTPLSTLNGILFPSTKTFIDPIQGMPIGGKPLQHGNDTPFYDTTAGTFAKLGSPDAWDRDGSGIWYGDLPFVNANAAKKANGLPFSFTAQTLLVATTKQNPNNLLMLGGFQWGFTVAADGNSYKESLMDVTNLAFSDVNVKNWDATLKQDFGGGNYSLTQAICNEKPLIITLKVKGTANPEPPSIVMMLVAAPAILVSWARRRYRCRRAS
jgi:hypothetical protein